ncbi:hypothetical protein B0H16DRAFT_1454436 [Mycena metata]|uniref:F-box domain-containing protein n=1 Tax=Mycena metata TaxID=1033252 RepID=A0AAD7JKK5_9AGAR|nr:hypothetical protein B0H16DRAFT_1454436 [Mycena metata]
MPHIEPDDFGKTPWYLAHICRYWRDVALATPFLWTEILIMGTNKYPLGKLETQLARSSNAPLKVLLWRSYSGQDTLIEKFIRLLVDCGPRWTNASLVIKPEHFALLSPLRGRIPLLRYLRIDVSNSFDERPGPLLSHNVTNPLEIAPALRDVTLEDVSPLPRGLVLPFGQLTRLKVATNHRRIVALLQTTPNLEHASLDFTTDPPAAGTLIRLAHLRRLYVSDPSFLNHLELPALEKIYMVDTGPAPFLSLISRCPTLRLKTLRVLWCNPRHIAEMLTACPTVHTLSVQIMSNDKSEELLRSLAVNATTRTCIGPNVESIAFGVDGAAVRYGLFVNMVESRWRVPVEGGCRRLRSVELLDVKQAKALNGAMEGRLKVLEREGLWVNVLQGSAASAELMEWRI